ncbi:hypothetical protein AAFA46_06500 [Oscillospiraceae bacterium WX1]
MVFVWLVILLLTILIAAFFIEPVRISFFLDTDGPDMHANARWTRNITIEARIIDYQLFLTCRLFRKKIFAQFLKKRGKNAKSGANIFKALALSDSDVKISYGLSEPSLTGIFCAVADFFAALIQNVGIELEPDFFPEREYLHVKAGTSLNLGNTAINLIKSKFLKRRKKYGSTA